MVDFAQKRLDDNFSVCRLGWVFQFWIEFSWFRVANTRPTSYHVEGLFVMLWA